MTELKEIVDRKKVILLSAISSIYFFGFIMLFLQLGEFIDFEARFFGFFNTRHLSIISILTGISILSLLFFYQIVWRINDSPLGYLLSFSLSLVFSASLILAIYTGLYVLIAGGFFFIVLKALQLYFRIPGCKGPENPYKTTKLYFKRMTLVLAFVTVVTFFIGLAIDTAAFPKPETDIDRHKHQVAEILKKSNMTGEEADKIKQSIDTLTNRLEHASTANGNLFILLIYILLFVTTFVIYRELTKDISLKQVRGEIEIFNKELEKKDDNN